MRRQFPAGTLYWLTAGLMFFVSAAGANVIYDVEVNYEGGYKYTFAMEFAELKPYLSEIDLVPGVIFQNERFSHNGTQWGGVVGSHPNLWFDPYAPNIYFISYTEFFEPATATRAVNLAPNEFWRLSGGQTDIVNATDVAVVVRQPDGIPEPASVTLLGLGLAGLAGMRRRAKKQSSPALILHDTNAASA